MSNGFIEETQESLPNTGQAFPVGKSKGSGLVSDPPVKEDINGSDIHLFRRFHVLNFQLPDRPRALQVDPTMSNPPSVPTDDHDPVSSIWPDDFSGLFFDIGVDPRDEKHPGGTYTWPLTEEEANMPAFSPGVVTKLKIDIKDFHKWPIIVERAEGVRCIDVLEAVYKILAVPLTAEDTYDYRPEFLDPCIPASKRRARMDLA